MQSSKTLITVLLAAGSLLLANPASAGDHARAQAHVDPVSHHPAGQPQRVHGQSHRNYRHRHSGKHYGGERRRYLGHDHDRHKPRYHHRRYYRPDVIVIPRNQHQRHHHYRSSGLSTITGGVIGGLVGNHIGHGDPVATGIGIVTGAVIGDHLRH